jgi:hypothetical protein
VAEIVDPAQRLDPSRDLRGVPLTVARHFVLAVASGGSGRRAFIEQSFKAKLKEFLPGRG